MLDRTALILTDTAPGDGIPPRAWRRDEPHRLDLSGEWRFRLSESVAEAPLDCDAEDHDDSAWETIDLPAHWVLTEDGRRGRPAYTNIQLPIPMDPPHVPDANPVGDHRRSFALPEWWEGLERIVLRFDGVESIAIVAVNGVHVGVVRGSRLATELDVTEVVREGENTVHVRVVQWSAQTYVEDQDQWWLPGIFREVSLIGLAAGGFTDHWLRADFDHRSGSGTLTAELPGANFPVTIRVPEYDVEVTWDRAEDVAPITIDEVTPWSEDRPHLSDVELTNDVDTLRTRVGFRTVTVEGDQWKVNGRTLRLRGVNRHEYHPDLGRVFDVAAAREGMLEMRRHNINAIRTSHYPPHPMLLELADELGFWVMDECDLETHAFSLVRSERNPSDAPEWRDNLLQRMDRTIRRDRNHPCVISWSLGNEAGTGANLAAMADLVHRVDPTRPVHYESDYEGDYTDIVSRMYLPIPAMRRMSAGEGHDLSPREGQVSRLVGKPKIQCEYVHAMGNGSGAVREYCDAFEELSDWMGGFIWEWRDHGIRTRNADGTEYFGYGGDFGEVVHDGNFVMDGLMTSDGRPSPMMAEVKQCYAPVELTRECDELHVENRFHAVDTAHLEFRWRLEVDGELRDEGTLDDVVVRPGFLREFPLPEIPDELREAEDAFLTVSAHEREERPWCEAGFEIGRWQFPVGVPAPCPLPRPTAAPTVAREVCVGQATLCPRTGRLLALGELEVAEANVELWRAPTDNDERGDFGSYELGDLEETHGFGAPGAPSAERWRKAGLDRLMTSTVRAEVEGDEFVVVQRLLPAQGRHGAEVTWRWRDVDGAAACRVLVVPIRPRTDTTWPRIGVHLLLPQRFEDARWFGGGPGEAYPDSRAASFVGVHEAPVAELEFDYAMPQETGHREALRRLTLTGDGAALDVEAFGPDLPGFSALSHDAHELTRARHQHELPESRGTHLYLDAFVHGLGSRACGPDVLPRYQLWPRKAEFGFMLRAR